MDVMIYALLDHDGRPRYIGYTKSIDQRLKAHWSSRRADPEKSANPQLVRWLASLSTKPHVHVLEIVPYDDRYEAERRWTAKMRQAHDDLLNIYDGANPRRRRVMSAETKAKISASRTGQTLSASHRRKLSEAQKASPRAAAHRRDLNELNRGAVRSDETRSKIADGVAQWWKNRHDDRADDPKT